MSGQGRVSMKFDKILTKVGQYYSEKAIEHGATAKGVDWNSPESQFLRFEQLIKVCNTTKTFSINDYGCGYGALVEYMTARGYKFHYHGFDISEQMIFQARELHKELKLCNFCTDESLLKISDYTVASGIFNVKLQTPIDEWENYVLDVIKRIAELSEKGFAFNILTKYSDSERMREDLYYADPCYWFDYCKRNFSRNVALLHDYNLYEFTIIVRK
jgi:SAM-dependent methyltransferase